MDQLPRLGKRELICLMLFTCNYVVSVWRGFLFLWVLGMGYVILLWQCLSLPYNYFEKNKVTFSYFSPGNLLNILYQLAKIEAPNYNIIYFSCYPDYNFSKSKFAKE